MRCDIHRKDLGEKEPCQSKAIYSVKLGVAGRLHLCLECAKKFEKKYPGIKFDRGIRK